MTCERSVEVGAYVLGALEPLEQAEVDAHLATCAVCRDELAELAGLPAVLARAGLADVDGSPPAPPVPPNAALERLLRRAATEREERRRRRVRRSLWAAAAAAVLLVGGLGAVAGDLVARPGEDRPSAVTTLAGTNAQTAVHVEVRLRSTRHGTELAARVGGVPPGERCRLVAVGRDGRSEVAATWTATYAGTAEVTGSTAVPAADLNAVRVVADDGTVLAVATSG